MNDSPRSGNRQPLDLWFESLTVCNEYFLQCWSLLDKAERSKAQCFLHELDRRRYVVSHGKLRKILAGYLNQTPEKLVFDVQDSGKPSIKNVESHNIKFNLTHSGDNLVVAVNVGNEIGVDIEVWKDTMDYTAVIELCFADTERQAWTELSREQKQRFFYQLWTRKESFVKSVGIGLGLDLSQVVSAPDGAGRFISLPLGYGSPESWRVIDLKLSEGLSGAVTVPVGCNPIICYKQL